MLFGSHWKILSFYQNLFDEPTLTLPFISRNVSPAHYTLKYNVMPHVGALTYGEAGRTLEAVAFPESRERVS